MKIFKILPCLMLSLTSLAMAESPIQNVKTLLAPTPAGAYSQGKLVDLSKGKLLFVSGQTEEDPKTGKNHDESMSAATNQALNNVEAVLKTAGTNFNNVLRCDIFLKNMKDWDEMNKEYSKHFSNHIYPARFAIQSGIEDRIEIACIAVVPEPAKSHRN